MFEQKTMIHGIDYFTIEIIDQYGRCACVDNVKVNHIEFQDLGKTMKIFVYRKNKNVRI